ncbi:hypothetical protein K449DRAFT_383442 [Hypoxylon sp. EC38]|nr:hypothetical protein K449DRAFT_383442 [Hypoxylon sp. EC38]
MPTNLCMQGLIDVTFVSYDEYVQYASRYLCSIRSLVNALPYYMDNKSHVYFVIVQFLVGLRCLNFWAIVDTSSLPGVRPQHSVWCLTTHFLERKRASLSSSYYNI